MAHAGGRPSHYNEKIAREICDNIAISTDGIRKLCSKFPHWPNPDTIYQWRIKHPQFAEWYAKAKQDQIQAYVDEIAEIADDTSHDTLIRQNKNGDDYEVCNSEWINRSRLRVDTRKWIASKLMPKLYGERTITDTNITFTQEEWLKGMKD